MMLAQAVADQARRPSRLVMTALVVAGVLLASAFAGLRAYSLPLMYVLVLLGGGLVALVALRDMSHGLTLLVVAAPTVPFAIATGTLSTVNGAMLLVALLAGLWVVRMVLTGRVRLAPSSVNGPLLAFLGAAGLSWLATTVVAPPSIVLPGNLFSVQAGQFALFALTDATFLLAANHQVSERVLKLWTGFIVVTGFSIMTYHVMIGWKREVLGWSGPLHMWPVVMVASQLLFNPKMGRGVKAAGTGALGLWAYWAATRSLGWKSGWVPAAFAVLLLLLLKSRRLFLIALVLLAAVTFALGPDVVAGALLATEEYSATPVRWNLWLDVFRLGARSVAIGLGPATYTFYWQDPRFESLSYEYVDPQAFTREAYAPAAHNMYADIFAQTGVAGLFLFLWVIAGAIRLGVQACRRPLSGFGRAHARAVLCGFVALAVSSFLFAEWLLPYVYNLGLNGFRYSLYSWLLLGTLVWLRPPAGAATDA